MSFKIRCGSEHTGRLGPLGAKVNEFQMKMSRNVNVETVKEAVKILEDAVGGVGVNHRLPIKTVHEIEQDPTKPAVVIEPVMRYLEARFEESSRTASTQSSILKDFEFRVRHNGGEHLESAVYLKAGYPRTPVERFYQLLQDVLFDIEPGNKSLCHVGDAQLLWNDSCAFSQWHADLKDRTVAVWSQLQRGRKLWFVAPGRRSLSWFVGSYRRDLLTWAGELKRKWPERLQCHVQLPGEVIYLPPGCAHCVLSPEASTLLSFHIELPEVILYPRTEAALKRILPDTDESQDEFERPTTQGSSKSKSVRKGRQLPKRKRKFCRDNSKR